MGRPTRDEHQLNGILDKGTSFEGKLAFDGTVQINGNFKGDIISDGTLIVGPEAEIDARIQVSTLIVDGSVHGAIETKQKLELHRGSHLTANVITPAIVIEEGAIFQGQCQMSEEGVTKGARVAEDGEDSLMM